ncbi:MAG: glycerol kinase GlpK [Candidatus Sericytochromatia bacterium]|nr:glycerol kinase GlpK [Candidatus Sericytochromatia bacterium]
MKDTVKKYILVLDQGTTSSRTVVFDYQGNIVSQANKEFKQIYPQQGWVEHDPEEIFSSQMETFDQVFADGKIKAEEIAGIGITNQRETTILWDKNTGKPVYNAIVWQCRRSKDICESLTKEGFNHEIKSRTGLVTDAYFSGTKIKWLFDTYPELKEKANNGDIMFGTVDSWLLYKLTKGKVHATDVSNASRTMLFNIHDLKWDQTILEKLDIPTKILPQVKSSSEVYGQLDIGYLGIEIPISGIAGDQQAALFGQTCFEVGEAKNTYGTGCFMLMNTGEKAINSDCGLLTSIAWQINGKTEYILEGSVFTAGAVIQWLRDELQIINHANETEKMAMSVKDNHGVYFVPAFNGLGTPYWNMNARGTISGLTRGANKNHIVRAALESIAYQTSEVLDCMKNDANLSSIKSLKVDGGGCVNNFLMQFQADLLNVEVERPKVIETTALGACSLAGLAIGFWKDKEEIKKNREIDNIFVPTKDDTDTKKYYLGWKDAINRVLK